MADTPPTEPATPPVAPPNPIVGIVGGVLSGVLSNILDNVPLRLKIADFAGTLIGSFAIKVGDHVVSKLIERRTEWAVPDAKLQAEMPDSGDIHLYDI